MKWAKKKSFLFHLELYFIFLFSNWTSKLLLNTKLIHSKSHHCPIKLYEYISIHNSEAKWAAISFCNWLSERGKEEHTIKEFRSLFRKFEVVTTFIKKSIFAWMEVKKNLKANCKSIKSNMRFSVTCNSKRKRKRRMNMWNRLINNSENNTKKKMRNDFISDVSILDWLI